MEEGGGGSEVGWERGDKEGETEKEEGTSAVRAGTHISRQSYRYRPTASDRSFSTNRCKRGKLSSFLRIIIDHSETTLALRSVYSRRGRQRRSRNRKSQNPSRKRKRPTRPKMCLSRRNRPYPSLRRLQGRRMTKQIGRKRKSVNQVTTRGTMGLGNWLLRGMTVP